MKYALAFLLLGACTQAQPAPVSQRGSERFSQRETYRGSARNAPAREVPPGVSTATHSSAGVEGISSRDLPPAK